MSSIPVVTPEDLPAMRVAARARPRPWVRSVAFAGLCAYGVDRWSRLLNDPPMWRLFGLAALAVALAVLVPIVRRLAAGTGEHSRLRGRAAAGVLAAALIIAALPVAGLRGDWVLDVRIAVSARAIGNGLQGLGTVLVPYLGGDYSIRLVMTLGAAVLLFDAAAALAFTGRSSGEIGEGRRAAAALPLVALAIVPVTLVPVAEPALQGLFLFGLLALFVWGERIVTGRRGAAVGMACFAGLVGVIAVPTLSSSRPWVNYQAWGGGGNGGTGLESFNWNQTYGPLSWPQDGRIMFRVRARTGDYWKAEDLTTFNGTAWVAGPSQSRSSGGGLLADSNSAAGHSAKISLPLSLPVSDRAVTRRYLRTVQVTIKSMTTSDVIAGSGITLRPQLAGGVAAGSAPGTWTALRPLGPGDTYSVTTYSPTPSSAQLQQAGEGSYPWTALAPDLTLTLPTGRGNPSTIPFPGFHRPLGTVREKALEGSPYSPALALAQRLATGSSTPYDFVRAVQHLLDSGGYIYDQRPQSSRYPLIDFLFHSRIGYCQQFSGAMAMLLRMGGLPARVAAGFTPGSLDAKRHIWTVSDTDAHAWVEVWFPTYGWVRFDPTPATDPAIRNSAISDEPRPGQINRAFDEGRFNQPLPHHQRTPDTTAHPGHVGRGGGGGLPRSGAGGGGVGWGWITGGVALVLLLAAGLWARTRRGPLDRLDELERALARTGRPLPGGATLASLERRFHGSPDAVAYVRALRLERYGHVGDTPPPSGRRAVRAELAAGLGMSGRLRALWALPPRRRPRTPRFG